MNKALARQNVYLFTAPPRCRLSVLGMTVELGDMGAETDGSTGMAKITLPAYCRSQPLHWHAHTTEACYVLEGLLAVTLGDETFTARQGSLVLVPPRTLHSFWNPVAMPASCLALYAPAGLEAYWEALSGLNGAAPEVRQALAARFDHFESPVSSR